MKQERFVINVVLRAKDIPNNYVTFVEDDDGYAIVASLEHEDVNYKAYNPKFKWAYYECL
jgi:hypothetical protein